MDKEGTKAPVAPNQGVAAMGIAAAYYLEKGKIP
jgi:hypothetical protein